MTAINWSKIYKKYKGLWVALADDQITVLGSGKTPDEAIARARKKSPQMPYLTRMPKTLAPYVGGFLL
jgi:hypothetical protein